MSVQKMKALRFHGKRDLRLDEINVPPCTEGLVKTALSKDSKIISTSPHPITGETLPLTIGHEFSGIVDEVGVGVNDLKVGQRVVVQPIIYDGTCSACTAGYINCCDKNGFVGLTGWGGGLAEYIVLPRSMIFPIPDEVSLEAGALVEPLAVAWHAIDMSGYQEGDWVLIIGGGPIGLAVLQCLKARGCDRIIVSEVGPQRLEYAKSFGANYVLDPTKVDLLARVREICDGQGAHVAFDAAGVQTGLEQAVLALRARGTLVNIAVWEKAPNFQVNNLVFRERKYLGVATYLDGDFQKVIDAIASGKLKPELMITSKIPFTEVEEKGFKPLVNERDKHVKILVQVNP